MPGLPSWLSDVSRKKLRLAAFGHDGLRDTINLHRFVLLKNSITQAESQPPLSDTSQPSLTVTEDGSEDMFVYPVASTSPLDELLEDVPSDRESEEKWLESVLETLDDELDGEVEVEVHPVEDDDDLEFSDLSSLYDSWSTPHDALIHSPISVTQTFLSSPSVLSPQSFPPAPPLQLAFDRCDSPFSQPFVEPRYPEADYDLPTSDGSSDSDSDDDEGPLTPYSGSQPSFDGQRVMEPEVYVEHDSYFLHPSELDQISPQPIYFQQC